MSERYTASRLDKVVEVKPTYILLFSEIQFPKKHLSIYNDCFCKTPIEGEELLFITMLGFLHSL